MLNNNTNTNNVKPPNTASGVGGGNQANMGNGNGYASRRSEMMNQPPTSMRGMNG
jgi:hypothetical protein